MPEKINTKSAWYILVKSFFEGYEKAIAINDALHIMGGGNKAFFVLTPSQPFGLPLLQGLGRPICNQNVYLAKDHTTLTLSLLKLYDEKSWSIECTGKTGKPQTAHDWLNLQSLLPW